MELSLLLRKTWRFLKSGSTKSRDYREYHNYLATSGEFYKQAFFNLTIDFELAWSGKRGITTKKEALERGRLAGQNLRSLLELLATYEIPATFAVVGRIAKEDITGEILKYQQHEIASHSFSHTDFQDAETNAGLAELEIAESRRALEEIGAKPDTFVFPNNRPAFLEILAKNKFTIYRNNLNGRIKMDAYGLWQFPIGIWTSPDAFNPSEAIELVKLATERKQLVNFWCHLYEFKNPDHLKKFFRPLLAFVTEGRQKGLILPNTMRNITSAINNE